MVSEREFWSEIRKNLPKYKQKKPRVVPAFTIQAMQVSLYFNFKKFVKIRRSKSL